MQEDIYKIIRAEVVKHEYGLDDGHVDTITDAIVKQLREVVSAQHIDLLVETMKPDFIKIVDILIPIVEEYENKIDELLNNKIGNLISKL
ncbi:hypothetical protein KBD45_03880 [Candidatus Dojkabacteria bacterium]|nr:hypothetical protein [Candidatus Dojkabacteria bacterium]